MSAGGTEKPIAAMAALGLRQPLLFFALGTLPEHLAVLDIFGKEKAAAGAGLGITLADLPGTAGIGTNKEGTASAAGELSFFHLFANGALLHL
jgi:hypothetical protein